VLAALEQPGMIAKLAPQLVAHCSIADMGARLAKLQRALGWQAAGGILRQLVERAVQEGRVQDAVLMVRELAEAGEFCCAVVLVWA
jgi:hypothetical protein